MIRRIMRRPRRLGRARDDRQYIESRRGSGDLPILGEAITNFPDSERLERTLGIHAELHRSYPARRFLQQCYLPSTRGPVLVVGVWPYNIPDWDLLPNPGDYHSIDIDPEAAPYGKPGAHRTVDFFDVPESESYAHIVLFGMFGARNDRTEDAVHLGVAEIPQMLHKADRLLRAGGDLLLGAELSGISLAQAEVEARTWSTAVHQSLDRLQHYESVYELVERCNWLGVFRKE